MHIAYIAPYLDKDIFRGGVGEKIGSQMRFWKAAGHEVELFFMTPDQTLGENNRPFQYQSSSRLPFIKSFVRIVSRSIAMSQLIEALRVYNPDLVYLRHGLYVPPMKLIFKSAPVIMEINSNDVSEYKYQGVFYYSFNLFTRGILFKNSAGLISPSHELAEINSNSQYHKRTCIIANGIDLEKYIPLPPSGNDNPVITMVGSPGMPWHGVDKLVQLADRYQDLKINIVGYKASDIGDQVPVNVRCFGFLNRDEVREVLKKSDLACGTLALHRKNMQEASPLKVREAMAYGIPVILGYRDTDLFDLGDDYVLSIPNTEDNVMQHAERIHSFAYKMMNKRIDRTIVANRIDQREKEKRRLAFFRELV